MRNFEKPGTDKLSSRYVFVSAILSKCNYSLLILIVVSSVIAYPHEVLRAR